MSKGARQYALLLGGGFIVIAVLAFVLMLPARNKLSAAQAQLVHIDGEIGRRQQRLRPLGSLTQRVNRLEMELKNASKTLPSHSALGAFLGRISRIVDSQRLSDLEITPGHLVTQGQMFRMPMKLTFGGTLGGVFAFLRELERLPYYTRVDELKIENDSKYTGRLTISLGISVFFSRDKQKCRGGES